jgi:hypothetical protein
VRFILFLRGVSLPSLRAERSNLVFCFLKKIHGATRQKKEGLIEGMNHQWQDLYDEL